MVIYLQCWRISARTSFWLQTPTGIPSLETNIRWIFRADNLAMVSCSDSDGEHWMMGKVVLNPRAVWVSFANCAAVLNRGANIPLTDTTWDISENLMKFRSRSYENLWYYIRLEIFIILLWDFQFFELLLMVELLILHLDVFGGDGAEDVSRSTIQIELLPSWRIRGLRPNCWIWSPWNGRFFANSESMRKIQIW